MKTEFETHIHLIVLNTYNMLYLSHSKPLNLKFTNLHLQVSKFALKMP